MNDKFPLFSRRLQPRRSSFFAHSSAPLKKLEDKKTPLILACENDDHAEVARLLEAGANPNEPCENGRRALHTACVEGSIALVHLLLERGADPNIPQIYTTELDPNDYVYLSVRNNSAQKIKRAPQYALPLAILYERKVELIQLLLRKANEDSFMGTDGFGDTALEIVCARDKNFELAKALVDRGAEFALVGITYECQQWLYNTSLAKGSEGLSTAAMGFLKKEIDKVERAKVKLAVPTA